MIFHARNNGSRFNWVGFDCVTAVRMSPKVELKNVPKKEHHSTFKNQNYSQKISCKCSTLYNWVESPGGISPPALTVPDVSLSTHPAPIIQPFLYKTPQWTKRFGCRSAICLNHLVAFRWRPLSFLYLQVDQRTKRQFIWSRIPSIAEGLNRP